MPLTCGTRRGFLLASHAPDWMRFAGIEWGVWAKGCGGRGLYGRGGPGASSPEGEASAAPASAAEHLNHAADEEGLLPSCLYRSLGRAWVVVLLPQP